MGMDLGEGQGSLFCSWQVGGEFAQRHCGDQTGMSCNIFPLWYNIQKMWKNVNDFGLMDVSERACV